MLQNDSHLNCLCIMARLIEALAICMYYEYTERRVKPYLVVNIYFSRKAPTTQIL